MKNFARWAAVIVSAMAVAVAAPVALGAKKKTTLKLEAPSSKKACPSPCTNKKRKFTLTAKGYAVKQETLRVFIRFGGDCSSTALGEEANSSFFAIKATVGPNHKYKEQAKHLYGGAPGKGKICGYLTPGTDPATTPDKRKSRKIEFKKA